MSAIWLGSSNTISAGSGFQPQMLFERVMHPLCALTQKNTFW